MKLWLKKIGKYALVIIPAGLLIFVLIKSKFKKNGSGELTAAITTVKNSLWEIFTSSEIEAKAVQEKNDKLLTDLQEVAKTKDDAERRKRLAALAKRTEA